MIKEEILICGGLIALLVALIVLSWNRKPQTYCEQNVQIIYDDSTSNVLLRLPDNICIQETSDGVRVFKSSTALFITISTEVYYFPKAKHIELNSINYETICNIR